MRRTTAGGWLIAAGLLLALPGCMSFTSVLLHTIKGPPKIPAAFDQLAGKRVAVICVSVANSHGPGTVCNDLAKRVHGLLAAHVEEIDMVPREEIDNWMDRNDWNRVDYSAIGAGVEADMVVAIELNRPFTLREGPTLFKGSADFTTTVYDIAQDGKRVFRRRQEDFQWPKHGRYGVSEAQFEKAYLSRVSTFIAQYFYDYEENGDIAADSSDVSGF